MTRSEELMQECAKHAHRILSSAPINLPEHMVTCATALKAVAEVAVLLHGAEIHEAELLSLAAAANLRTNSGGAHAFLLGKAPTTLAAASAKL